MNRSVKEIAEFVQARALGDDKIAIERIASLESAKTGDLVFVEDEKNLELAIKSNASAVIAGEFAAGSTASKPLLIAKQPKLAFAKAALLLHPKSTANAGIHSSAVVDDSAKLGNQVTVEARVVIETNAQIGDGSRIGAGSVIGKGVLVG